MSTYFADVISVKLEPHSNADTLSLVHIGGFQVVVRTADWSNGQLGVYIPPETIVDTRRPEFAFLATGKKPHVRVKARRLRDVWSVGLLIPAPSTASIGDNLWEYYGLEHYQPDEYNPLVDNVEHKSIPGCSESIINNPFLACVSKYDIENGRQSKYQNAFEIGEDVYVSEKIHGQNMRVVYSNERMWVGSRTLWKKDGDNCWWNSMRAITGLEQFCRINPNYVVYGECYGKNPGFRYDTNGTDKFRAFDIRKPDGCWLDANEFLSVCVQYNIPIPTIMYLGPLVNWEQFYDMVEQPSTFNNQGICEGVVIRPCKERNHQRLGRVIVKIVSNNYLSKT